MIEEISAGIVLFRRENEKIFFLLLHYPSGHWDFVKGKMENGERRNNASNSNKGNKRRNRNNGYFICRKF